MHKRWQLLHLKQPIRQPREYRWKCADQSCETKHRQGSSTMHKEVQQEAIPRKMEVS